MLRLTPKQYLLFINWVSKVRSFLLYITPYAYDKLGLGRCLLYCLSSLFPAMKLKYSGKERINKVAVLSASFSLARNLWVKTYPLFLEDKCCYIFDTWNTKKSHLKEGTTVFYLSHITQKYLYHISIAHNSCFKQVLWIVMYSYIMKPHSLSSLVKSDTCDYFTLCLKFLVWCWLSTIIALTPGTSGSGGSTGIFAFKYYTNLPKLLKLREENSFSMNQMQPAS